MQQPGDAEVHIFIENLYKFKGFGGKKLIREFSDKGWNVKSHVITTWMGDCLRTGKPSWYITNTKVNSAFHPSGVGKSSTDLHGLCRVAEHCVIPYGR